MSALSHTLDLLSSGERWPTLGLGTWRLGESARSAAQEVDLICTAIRIGYRLFDTAEMYGEGGAERVLGQALARGLCEPGVQRDHLRVVSKAYPHHGDAAGLKRACDASRRRLKLDTIDLYLLHWRGDIPLSETMRGFAQLQQLGWIRHWGISNFDVDDLDELRAAPGAESCAANQVYYSLSERGIEFDLLPRMREQRMALMAYSPIDGGRISRHASLAKLAASLNVSAAQIALAWLLHQPGVIAIPKAARERHLIENWRSRDLALPPHVLSELEALFPKPTGKRRLVMR
ncbi:MAG TPA: aldo/keto reductase [Burkholderiaceae bacterium]|nr:aldo/keto reductase [Burkholderiaceae bacterium]